MLKDDIQKQVKKQCSNYDKNGLCLLGTGAGGCRSCPFFNGEIGGKLPRCPYYENAVLPADEKLKARYWQSYWNEKGTQKVCEKCSMAFIAKSNRQKYCSSCGEVVRQRQKSKQNARYYREKVIGENN